MITLKQINKSNTCFDSLVDVVKWAINSGLKYELSDKKCIVYQKDDINNDLIGTITITNIYEEV